MDDFGLVTKVGVEGSTGPITEAREVQMDGRKDVGSSLTGAEVVEGRSEGDSTSRRGAKSVEAKVAGDVMLRSLREPFLGLPLSRLAFGDCDPMEEAEVARVKGLLLLRRY